MASLKKPVPIGDFLAQDDTKFFMYAYKVIVHSTRTNALLCGERSDMRKEVSFVRTLVMEGMVVPSA